jgi:hypothetical protein
LTTLPVLVDVGWLMLVGSLTTWLMLVGFEARWLMLVGFEARWLMLVDSCWLARSPLGSLTTWMYWLALSPLADVGWLRGSLTAS